MRRLLAPMVIVALAGVLAAEIPTRGLIASPATTQPATTQAVTTPTPLAIAASAPASPGSNPPPRLVATEPTAPADAARPLASTSPATTPTTLSPPLAASPTTASLALGTRPTTGVALAGATSQTAGRFSEPASGYSYGSRRSRFDDSRSRVPDAAPAQAPGPNIIPRPISRDYSPVLTRSIFLKGRQNIYADPFTASIRPPYVAQTQNSTEPATTAPDSSSSPESVLVFNGASDVDGQLTAFIENTGLNVVTRLHPGDAIAEGKIVGLSLDSLDYAVGNRVTHVMIGQNLLGADVVVLTTQPVSSTSQPSGTDSSGAQQSILERLRQRRLQELGQ